MKISTIGNMPDEFELVLFGDNQTGNKASAEDKFLSCIEYIMEGTNRYGAHMGDAIDAFWIDDPRFNPSITTQTPLKQKDHIVKLLTPLVQENKLITILKGNHELKLDSKAGDMNEDICKSLRQLNNTEWPITGTYNHKLEFTDTKNKLISKAYLTHGKKTINSISPDPHRKRAYMQFRLKRLLENMASDCILMARGHSHIVLVTPPLPALYLHTLNGKIKQGYTKPGTGQSVQYIPPESRWYGCTGSFLKSQLDDGTETYSEIAEYEPVELGYLKAIFAERTCQNLIEVKV